MSESASGEPLRATPRQQRSEKSIDEILDAAVRLAETIGVEQLTTVLVAKEAGVSVGRVYYWFEDKQALVDAARAKSHEKFSDFLSSTLRDVEFHDASELVETHVRSVLRYIIDTPASLDLLDLERANTEANQFRQLMAGLVDGLLLLRVDGIGAAERELVSTTIVSVVLGMAENILASPVSKRDVMVEEAGYVVFTYLHGRYPHVSDHVWSDPQYPVQPSLPVLVESGRAKPVYPPRP